MVYNTRIAHWLVVDEAVQISPSFALADTHIDCSKVQFRLDALNASRLTPQFGLSRLLNGKQWGKDFRFFFEVSLSLRAVHREIRCVCACALQSSASP